MILGKVFVESNNKLGFSRNVTIHLGNLGYCQTNTNKNGIGHTLDISSDSTTATARILVRLMPTGQWTVQEKKRETSDTFRYYGYLCMNPLPERQKATTKKNHINVGYGQLRRYKAQFHA